MTLNEKQKFDSDSLQGLLPFAMENDKSSNVSSLPWAAEMTKTAEARNVVLLLKVILSLDYFAKLSASSFSFFFF